MTRGKLVRDKIPEIIRRGGELPTTRVLHGEEFLLAIRAKVVEEAQELYGARTLSDMRAELADLYEVLELLGSVCGISLDSVRRERERKGGEKGFFKDRVFLCE